MICLSLDVDSFMKTNEEIENLFWKDVFIRIIKKNFFNETFRAANNGIVEKFEYWRSDMRKALDYCLKSEDTAYDFFIFEFSRLTEKEQILVSGKTRDQWNETEANYRNRING